MESISLKLKLAESELKDFVTYSYLNIMNNSAIHSNKQRGIYSEIIIPDNSGVYQSASGPDDNLYISTQQRQKIPKATALSKKEPALQPGGRATQKRKTMEKLEKIIVKIGQDDDFDLRVEPKVFLFSPRWCSPTTPSLAESHERSQSTARRKNTPVSAYKGCLPKKVPLNISKASTLRRRDGNHGFLSTILTIHYLMIIRSCILGLISIFIDYF